MSGWLFVCDTPSQVVSAIAIAAQLADSEGSAASLVVCGQFDVPAAEYTGLAKRSGLFRDVHLMTDSPPAKSFRHRARMAGNLIGLSHGKGFPAWLRETSFEWLAVPNFLNCNIEVLGLVRQTNPDVKTVLFEDGSGTYDGNVFAAGAFFGVLPEGVHAPTGAILLKRQVKRLLFGRCGDWNIERVWAKRPDLIAWRVPWPVSQFSLSSVLDIEGADALAPCLGLPADGVPSVIFFDPSRDRGEPIDPHPFDTVASVLAAMGVPLFRRSHPRSTVSSALPAGMTDVSQGQWELICHRNSLADAVLVGCSSAMLTPLIECGERPHLVFLHKLCFSPRSYFYVQYGQFVSIAEHAYADAADRVYAPASVDEAVVTIARLSRSSTGSGR